MPRRFDHLVGGEGPATVTLVARHRIEARIDRRANPNGTARIMAGAALRDWFQELHSRGDTVPVRFEGPRHLVIG